MGSKSDQFINELVQFYRNRGSNNVNYQHFITRLNGRIVDLWQLYSYVTEFGGSYKVNQSNLWDDIYCRLFKTSISGANISVALRQIYSRFLLPYEKAFSSNFGNDMLDDEDEENSSTTFSSNLSTPSLFHQHYQSSATSLLNSNHDHPDPFNKLYCSLLSGLPNELDFALKVSTILANSKKLDWFSNIKFIDLLLECCPYYCCICSEEVNCDDEHINSNESHCKELSMNKEALSMSKEALSMNKGALSMNKEGFFTTCKCYERFWFQYCNNEQVHELVFGLRTFQFEELSSDDFQLIYRRLKTIAELIRNLSFTYEENDQLLTLPCTSGGTVSMLRFLILLMMCDDSLLNNISYDIISNIITSMAFTQSDEPYYHLKTFIFKQCTFTAMTSNNVYHTSRCLEIISRILYFSNEDVTNSLINDLEQQQAYLRIIQLLTCQNDISVLLSTLEFCFALSEQQPDLLIKGENKYLIKILLCLLNCDASNHFTTSALEKIRIIDERPRTNVIASIPTNQNQPQINQSVNNLTQVNVDNETFALNWLRATYEPNTVSTNCPNIKISDLYADYVKQCCRAARKNVIAAQSFTQLVKKCFPSSNITNNCSVIEGISLKSNSAGQKSQPQQPLLASPILKAHLSAPPKLGCTNNSNNNTSNSNATTSTSTSNSTSTLSNNTTNIQITQPIPTTNTSTLIKSLLANKLRSNAVVTTSPLVNSISSNVNTISNITTSNVATLNITTTPNVNTSSNVSVIETNPVTTTQLTTVSVSMGQPITGTVLTSTAPISSQQLQAPQQFLLVRTIITNSNQQQPGSANIATTGTPVRLILPASMLTQQRTNNISVNGIANQNSTQITNVSLATSTSPSLNTPTTTITNSSDLFLKTVLSGPTNSNSVSPIVRNSVKSSPLLNVLLDKGKLPDFNSNSSSISSSSNSITTNTITTNVMQPQTPKMFILTTNSPLAIKSIPNLQTSQSQQISVISNSLPSPSTITTSSISSITSTTSNSSNQITSAPIQQQNPQNSQENRAQLTFKFNGEINDVTKSIQPTKIITAPVQPITSANTLNTLNALNTLTSTSTATLTSTSTSTSTSTIVNTDLSSIKDIKKTVDDATKLISKRTKSEENEILNKKFKPNVQIDSLSSHQTSNSNNNESPKQNQALTPSSNQNLLEYECLWHECNKSFLRSSQVFLHVYETHVIPSTFPNIMTCQWGGPEGIGPGCQSKRPKLSLLTHILDFHCNPAVLQQYVCRKQQLANTGATTITMQQPPAHPGYAQNAAILAIRRHATNYVEPPTKPIITKTTPLTVSIRLTAALILRNLADYSLFVKYSLESYEQYLTELCMSDGREESRTIAQCLAVIMDKQKP